MTDKELIERAARAAGIEGEYHAAGIYQPKNELRAYWNPLADDGDALRLAAILRINIEHTRTMSGAPYGVNCWPVGRGDLGTQELDIEDYNAATRRAITRAAAAMAK